MKKFLIVLEKTINGYSSFTPDLPGCIATGRTKKETEKNMYESIQFHIDGMKEEKIKLPKAHAESEVLVFN